MRPTQQYLEERFRYFNSLVFAQRLPLPPITVTTARTYLGQCSSRSRRGADGHLRHYDFKISISVLYDRPADDVDDTLVHEMIHYFIYYNGLRDTAPHGSVFKALMASINSNYGRKIRVSHRGEAPASHPSATSPATPPSNATAARPHAAPGRGRTIAVVTLSDGTYALKVLPSDANKIGPWCERLRKAADVKDIFLAITDDPYFRSYPVSDALRLFRVHDPSELQAHLNDATPVTVTGPDGHPV